MMIDKARRFPARWRFRLLPLLAVVPLLMGADGPSCMSNPNNLQTPGAENESPDEHCVWGCDD